MQTRVLRYVIILPVANGKIMPPSGLHDGGEPPHSDSDVVVVVVFIELVALLVFSVVVVFDIV